MSNENSNNADPIEPQEQSLDDFEKELFGNAPVAPVEEKEESTPTSNDLDDTPSDDGEEGASDDPPVDDPIDEENDDPEENEGEADPKPKKKTRAQERIEELNAKYREEERQKQEEMRKRIELEERLAKLEKGSDPNKEENQDLTPKEEGTAPHWDDVDDKGEKKYPLGQFDPQFNADLVRFTMQQELEAREAEKNKTEQQKQIEAQEQQLQSQWEEKLAPAQERYPDFQEKGQALISRFDNLDQGYAKYLTQTLQRMDNGPDVLYHLASNPDLAQEIVDQGPAMASVALGRLSAQFETKVTTPKATSAPPPPPRARGSAPPKKRDPLNNLDDFEKDFFKG